MRDIPPVRSHHPARGPGTDMRVLIVCHDRFGRARLADDLSTALGARFPRVVVQAVGGVADTEGLGVCVVVLGGSFPLVELAEMRAHPRLCDTTAVLFAPGKVLPALGTNVVPVVSCDDPIEEVIGEVLGLLASHGEPMRLSF